jgi:WD40 repeat protein
MIARITIACAMLLLSLSVARAESVLSPDSKTALVSHTEGKIRLWDLTESKVIRVFSGHTGSVTTLAYSADGKTFLSGGEDGTVRLWSIAGGDEVWGVNYEGDRRYPLLRQYGNTVRYVGFMPDGETVLSAQHDGTIKLWDSQSGKATRTFKTIKKLLWSANLSQDGLTAVTTSAEKDRWTIHLWDVATGEEVKRFNDTATAVYAAFLTDGKRLLSGGKQSLRLWDSSTGKLLQTLPNPTLIDSVALTPDSQIAWVGAAYKGSGIITVWDINAGKIIRRLRGHTDRVGELSFSPDSATALSGGNDHALIKWDVPTGRLLVRIKER